LASLPPRRRQVDTQQLVLVDSIPEHRRPQVFPNRTRRRASTSQAMRGSGDAQLSEL